MQALRSVRDRHPKGAVVVFGGQVGSEGKGAVAGYLARKYNWGAAICSFMTNAGHTWIGDAGEKVVVQQLPMAVVNPEIPLLLIAPGSAITLSQLEKEINTLDAAGYRVSERLRIDPRAMIIEEADVEYEREGTKYLASTSKGCGRALARKAMRSKDVRLARDIPWLKQFITYPTEMIANKTLDNGHGVLVEGSQGFDLDINHGLEYPMCTSRQTTPMQTLADCGIAGSRASRTIAVLRTYPIRVGNVVENGKQVGYSGDFGGEELTWEEITRRSGSPVPLEERTTVTQRVRRVFEMDLVRLETMGRVCQPTDIALTFLDYLDYKIYGGRGYVRELIRADDEIARFIARVEHAVGAGGGRDALVTMAKSGEKDSHMFDDTYLEWQDDPDVD